MRDRDLFSKKDFAWKQSQLSCTGIKKGQDDVDSNQSFWLANFFERNIDFFRQGDPSLKDLRLSSLF